MYSVFAGAPLVIAASVGDKIRQEFPQVTSIGSYVRSRYGRVFECYIAFNVVLNLAVSLAAEYTAVGQLFSDILDTSAVWPVVVIGCITMVYTVAGGLYVSILTDQYQSIFSLVLLGVVSIYLAIFFRVSTPLPPLPPQLGANELGYASILSLSVSLTAATLLSDAIWQRVWSAKDQKALRQGAWMGAGLTSFVWFYFGMAGFMATWLGIAPDASTAFFYLIKWVSGATNNPDLPSPTSGTPPWLLGLVCIIAVTMNESAVDSFQNALADTIVSLGFTAGKHIPITYARVAVLLINVPIMIIGVQGYNIGNLYLITNLLTTCSVLPMLLGLFKRFHFITGTAALIGSILGLFSVITHGWIVTGSFVDGVALDFYSGGYDWPPFVCGLVGSVVGTFLAAFVELLIHRMLSLPVFAKYFPPKEIEPEVVE